MMMFQTNKQNQQVRKGMEKYERLRIIVVITRKKKIRTHCKKKSKNRMIYLPTSPTFKQFLRGADHDKLSASEFKLNNFAAGSFMA